MSSHASTNVEREIRLALVMNGGISLAVWMGGVTSEIDALRRASFGLKADEDSTFDLWQMLIGGLRTRVIVDIIAGASAGGINGAVLATAIARGRALPNLRETWIDTADFDSHLIDKDPDSDRRSILDGDFFLGQLRKTFGGAVGPSQEHIPADAESFDGLPTDLDRALRKSRESLGTALARERALPRAITLVVTGTALRGAQVGYADATGQAFQYADSRVRFTFRRDVRGTIDDFADEPADRDGEDAAPTASDRLARAARATASFPGAFEPVFVNTGSAASPVDEALGDVPEGPDMSKVAELPASRWVIDGGVLDNEPFLPVLNELIHRPVDSDVRRVLAYVVPSLGGQGDPPRGDAVAAAPGMVESALAATNLPRELGILDDLARMRELQYNAEVNRTMRIRLLDALLQDPGGPIAESAAAVYDLYRRRRLDGAIWENRVVAATANGRGAADLRPLPTPVDLPDDHFNAGRPWMPPAAPDGAGFEEIIGADPADWCWGVSVAVRFVRAMMGRVRDALQEPQSPSDRTELSAAALTLSTCLERVLDLAERFNADVASAIGAAGAFDRTDEDVLSRIDVAFDAAAGKQPTAEVLGHVVRCAAMAAVQAPAAFPEVPIPGDSAEEKVRKLVRAFLLADVLEGLTRDAASPPDSPRFTFHRFGLNPRTWYFDGGETIPQTKLAGTRFGHFGAFFKQAWRLHDWIWGRLDGASQLVDVLLDKDLLPLGEGSEPAFDSLRAALVELAGESAGQALDTAKDSATDKDLALALERLRRLVVRRLHREILVKELPGLVARYENDMPAGVSRLGRDPDDERLRDALERIHKRFTTTSLAKLTGDATGREGEWLTVASALRALTLDDRVPDPLRGPIGWAAGWARGHGEKSFRGVVQRTGEKVMGQGVKAVRSAWSGASGVLRAVTFRS